MEQEKQTMPSNAVDVRGLAHRAAFARLFERFEALTPGESLELVSGDDPRLFLGLLQYERKGLFDWIPLENGPSVFRALVSRREGTVGALRRLTEALSEDHRRIGEFAQRAWAARLENRFDESAHWFLFFAHGLARHLAFEEKELFPLFERITGLSSENGPTATLRDEHKNLRALLDETRRAFVDPATDVDPLQSVLMTFLDHHSRKEDKLIYPEAEKLLTSYEHDELVERFQIFDL